MGWERGCSRSSGSGASPHELPGHSRTIEPLQRFGGIYAVADVSFSLARGEVTALIGPNGAGKTTLINLLTGVLTMDCGRMRLDGLDLTGTPAHALGKAGIARTYQTPQMARGMSVLTNVMAGAHRFGAYGLLTSLLRPWRAGQRIRTRGARERLPGTGRSSGGVVGPAGERSASTTSAVSKLRVRSPRIQRSFCSTSRPPGSIP